MFQYNHPLYRQKAHAVSVAACVWLILNTLLPFHSSQAQSYQPGSSMDAFAKAGNALKLGLAKPQSSDGQAQTISTKSDHTLSTASLRTTRVSNPLSQLATFQPKERKKTVVKTKKKSPQKKLVKLSFDKKKTTKINKIDTAEEDNILKTLRKELETTKEQLAIAELEVSRLSAILQSHSRARLAVPSSVKKTKQSSYHRSGKQREAPSFSAPTPDENIPVNDMQVATVATKKAYLRLGPGKQHSTLMALREGSRLAVEMRQGEWYRVFAPNGQRAWIHSSVLTFGDGAHRLNDGSSIATKGVIRGKR